MKKLLILIVWILGSANLFAQKILSPSDEGSKVNFNIRNFGIKTNGTFSGLKGKIIFDLSNISTWAFDVTVQPSTVNTNNGSRDGHLKKPDYFDASKYPTIRLVSTEIKVMDKPGVYQFIGNLTIKGVTKPIQFPFKVNKSNGGYVFTGDFGINRRDFGVGSNSISLADNLTVSLNVFAK